MCFPWLTSSEVSANEIVKSYLAEGLILSFDEISFPSTLIVIPVIKSDNLLLPVCTATFCTVVTPPTIEKLSCEKPIEVISPSAFVFTYLVTTSACPSLSRWTTSLFTTSPSTVLFWISLKLISTFTLPLSGSIRFPSAVRKYTS